MRWQDRHKIVPAVYLLIRLDGKVLMCRRFNTGYCDGMYSLPAGHLDGGESARTALLREAKEEVGLDLEVGDLRLVHAIHRVAQEGDHERIDLFFETKKWQGTPKNMEPEKCDDVRWFDMNKLPEDITPEVKQVLERFKIGEIYSEFGF
jgi:ADP-ribose pyrophosphatase YjhB (NUDIX family)